MSLYFGTQQMADLDALIRAYPESEFRSPSRSTVPLLSLIKHGGPAWTRFSPNWA